jgi:hypothetical protein
MNKIKRLFTLWYIKRGYTFHYDFTNTVVFDADYFTHPVEVEIPKAVWTCPRWVRPLLIFFSPSIYYIKTDGEALVKGFLDGLQGLKQQGNELQKEIDEVLKGE